MFFCKSPEHIHAPSSNSREEPRAKVSCWVYGIPTVQTHGHPNGQDDQTDAQRLHAFGGTDILSVSDGQDAEDQCSSCNNL